ncbi:MAG TPA: sulfur carrier protein ThiS [Moraxellaceae bacterium]|nr:sulfur carrier protein ThiS [Moraxellaceae bacterium]
MQIQLNGQAHELAEGSTLAALVASLDLGGRRIAVELNGEIAPRSQHAGLILRTGDRVEIVHAIGGG